ncbi:O-methyltransferase [Cronobacter dublinensis]
MANSGRKIDYRLRPAKNIERKMIRDILLRLSPFGIFSEYQYVGFGSKYFVDFVLMHKYLGIEEMISIEADTTNRSRYKFNRPYECIDVKFGHSTEVLPTLNLSKKSIYWMDYDSPFNKYMFSDLSTIVERCPSGTVVLLSYNSEPYKIGDLKAEYNDIEEGFFRRKFESVFGNEFIPAGFDERGFSNKTNYSKFIRGCLHSQLESTLSNRNVSLQEEHKITTKQICYFDYSDGTNMSTVGFIVTNKKDLPLVDLCRLHDLYFYSQSDACYEIKVPNLTSKETRFLMEKMPSKGNIEFDNKIFTEKDVSEFQANYKYYPSFMEIDFL